MSRVKASASHLLLSLIIFSIVISALIFFWYPAPYFTASGGWQGLRIAAGVDLVLGPLLTFVIFDIKKSRTKLIGDLVVIALLQFSALAWGVSTIYQQRPVAVVFWETEFLTVPAKELESQGVDLSRLAKFGSDMPVLIYAEKPRELEALKLMAKRISEQRIPPHQQISLYRDLTSNYAAIKSLQVDINEIIASNSVMRKDLKSILDETGTKITDYDYFPLRSKYHTIILMFSNDGELKNYIVVPFKKS